MSAMLPEDDLSCPVCCDIFKDPVLLPCSHSFCRACLQRFWNVGSSRTCPVCRRRASKKSPPSNLALRNLCEAFLQGRSRTAVDEEDVSCSQHGEVLKLFCLDDQLPICVVCQASKTHKGHDCSPTEEAALDCKDKLSSALKTLKDNLDMISNLRMNAAVTLEHIKCQAQRIEKRMKDQFLELHQFLIMEEEARMSALKEEEEKKIQAVKERDDLLMSRMSSLLDIIRSTEKEMAADDLTLLQNFKSTIERTQCSLEDSEGVCGALMDEAKHLSNLKFKVWENMQEISPYSPVTLDPNTAHPCLCLSDDLTSVHYSSPCRPLPSNPERFHISAEVLGRVALCSGTHSWDVEVGTSDDWILGVASVSIKRDKEVQARPENGFWTLCLRDGEYRAMASPPMPLDVKRRLQRVRVQLNWEAGEVTFSCPVEGSSLHTFSHTFIEKVLPYFYTQSKHPLRVVPKPVLISVMENRSNIIYLK
ncbi:zinc-binding protein A33-like [Astyanax mexicanus]|uniref:Zinc-binding protein A33-like n=1 Tax=Astyanax mexicanus TaxID=7994 RepID=A0A8B9GX18_ASTMX|nr:zinc-binding protein A33-like [Astyanax mexicanus]